MTVSSSLHNTTLQGPRPARAEEQAAIIATLNLIFRTSRGWEPTIGTDWPHVYAPENLPNVNIVTDGDQVVASTGLWVNEIALGAARLRIGGISCVGTLPDYRRYGLGSHVMQAAQQRMAELGCHVGLLFTGIPNWYRRLGWERAGTERSYHVDRGNLALLPELPAHMTSRVAERADDPAIVRLHNAAALGGLREVSGFRQLLTARKVTGIYVAEAAGEIVAYLLWKDTTITEWAGPAPVVAGLVRKFYAHLDDPAASTSQRAADHNAATPQFLTLTTPLDQPLCALLDQHRIPAANGYAGMLYTVDPQAILTAFGHDDIRVTETDGNFSLEMAGARVQLSRGQLTKCLFGPERFSDFGGNRFPLPFCQWYLEKV